MNLRHRIERLEMTDRHAQEVLWLLAFMAGVGWFWYSSALYDGHQLAARDLAFFTQSLWNATHGHGLRTTIGWAGDHLFNEHVYLTHWLLAPLYWLLPHPYTLLAVQAGALALAAVAAFRLARALHLPALESLALAALVLAHPSFHGAASGLCLYGYHPDVLIPALTLFAFDAYVRGRRRLCLVLVAASLATAEQYAVVWAGIAAWMFWSGKRRDGMLLAGLALGWLFVGTAAVLALAGQERAPWYHSALKLSGSPGVYLDAVAATGLYCVKQLALLAGLPLLTTLPLAVLPMLALYAQADTVGYTVPLGVMSWHAAAVVPVLILSAALGLRRLRERYPGRAWLIRVGLAAWAPVLLATSLSMAYWVHPRRLSAARSRRWAAAVSRLPDDASLSATSFAAAQLSNRRDLYIFPKLADAQWVLIDRGERIRLSRDARDALKALRSDPGWVPVTENGRISLYHRASLSKGGRPGSGD